MRVWIDQEQCTGSGLCETIEPKVFAMDEAGLACVRDGDTLLPSGPDGVAVVPPGSEDLVLEASQACPGCCIRIEADDASGDQ